jgi:hypothetical protein
MSSPPVACARVAKGRSALDQAGLPLRSLESELRPHQRELAASEAQVLAEWTDDDAKSTRVNHELEYYTGQANGARAIDDAYAARHAVDE